MSKILKNNTVSNIELDFGVTVPASGQYTLNPTEYLDAAASDDLVTEIGAANITVNDGSSDLSISDGMDLIKGIFPNPVGIQGGTDQTQIGNVGDCLKVVECEDGGTSFIHIDQRLGELGDPDDFSMDVNGSTTNVDFYYEVPVGEGPQYWQYLSIFVADSGSSDTNDFGAINGGLSNGLQLFIRLGGTEYQIGNFKDNVGLSLCFSQHATMTSGTGESSGWFDSSDFFMGTKEFVKVMKLEEGDRIIMRVRDNLTGLNEMGAVVRLYREI